MEVPWKINILFYLACAGFSYALIIYWKFDLYASIVPLLLISGLHLGMTQLQSRAKTNTGKVIIEMFETTFFLGIGAVITLNSTFLIKSAPNVAAIGINVSFFKLIVISLCSMSVPLGLLALYAFYIGIYLIRHKSSEVNK